MFIVEYIKHPRNVGAIAPSGKHLAHKMIGGVDFKTAKCIVEYGPGTGVFTEKLLARMGTDTILLLLETNKQFYEKLQEEYGYKENVIILNDSAENIDEILKEHAIDHVDYVISGLPFASLPKEISKIILEKTAELVEEQATFITFQYSLVKLKFFKQYFREIRCRKVMGNLPPAYVLECHGVRNEKKNISSRR